MLRRIEMPLSASESNLQLSEEVERNTLVLYRENENTYTFVGLHNPAIPDEEYLDGIVAFPLKSVFCKTVDLANNTSLWNVKGSSGDFLKNPDKQGTWQKLYNWVEAWERLTGGTRGCYVSGGNVICADSFVGGHMQDFDPAGKELPTGATVYIIPICQNHNHTSVTGELRVDSHNPERMTVPALEIYYERPRKKKEAY